jgi:predicted enzyme related to lactoylglutathione lyase
MTDPKPGFVWYELMTTDQQAAEKFYTAVVGWKMADAGQPHMRYTILSAGDRAMGGLMALPREACDAGARPGWLGYVGVSDTDDAAKRIVEAGGSIHRAPENIPNVGRFAVVADPGGAVFQLLTPLPGQAAPPPAEPTAPGLVSWHELYSSIGQEKAFAFYAKQFGWETLDLMDMGPMGKYRIFGTGGVPLGGMMDKPAEAPASPASAWNYYVNVDGIDAAIERIKKSGGQLTMGPHEVPGGSWIVQAIDPQGALFALVSTRR